MALCADKGCFAADKAAKPSLRGRRPKQSRYQSLDCFLLRKLAVAMTLLSILSFLFILSFLSPRSGYFIPFIGAERHLSLRSSLYRRGATGAKVGNNC
jgi:hypothetical protein